MRLQKITVAVFEPVVLPDDRVHLVMGGLLLNANNSAAAECPWTVVVVIMQSVAGTTAWRTVGSGSGGIQISTRG